MNVEKLIRTIDGQVVTLIPVTTVLQTEVPVATSSSILPSMIAPSSSVLVTYSSLITSTQTTQSLSLMSSISSTQAIQSLTSSATTTSQAFNLGTPANSGSVEDASRGSSKIGLIIGLAVGIPIFLFALATVIWYYKFRNRPVLFKGENNFKNIQWKNSNDDAFMMTKSFKVVKNIITPVAAATKDSMFLHERGNSIHTIKKSDSMNGIDNWKAHIFTPFKNSFITDVRDDCDIDLEKNDSEHDSDSNDDKSGKSRNISSSSNDDFDIEKFLYTNPPKIKNISSEVSSFKSNEKTKKKTKKCMDLNLDNVQDTQSIHQKWTYTSPLSKWFLRDSTYLQDSQVTTPADQILSVDLKTLQLPSKEKNITKKNSKVNLNPKRKHIIDINGMKRLSAIMHIKEKPLPMPPVMALEEKRMSRMSVLTGSFQKPSSETKKSNYVVIKSYTPQMLDELELVRGQIVRIISVHSDGWALVTLSNRCGIDGDLEHAGENGCTGVVPLLCLKKM